ncbi:MAG: flagellar hook-associated protein FlgL [Sphingomonas sp.]
MTISNSLFYDRTAGRINTLATQTQTLQTQISTGQKFAGPSDNPVAYQRLQRLAVATANDTNTTANISLAQTLLSQTDSALGDVATQIQRAQELAIQANNGTLSAADRKVVASQLRSIVDDLVTIANSKDARGGPLFGAATGDTAVTVDAAGAVSFTGTGTPASIPIGDAGHIQPTETAERVFGGITGAGGATTLFAAISNLADAFDTNTNVNAAAGATIDGLKSGLDQINGLRGSVGARGARLDLETNRLQDTGIAREADRSGLEDTDLTAAIANLQKASTILQATQASFTRLSQLSLFDYIR